MYKNLDKEMREKNITKDDIADIIKTSTDEAGRKINGEDAMTFREGITIWKGFFPEVTFEYLFENDE